MQKFLVKILITDKKGNLRGSFFIDDPNVKLVIKSLRLEQNYSDLVTLKTDSKVVGVSDSNGEAEFTSSGILQTTQETIISVRNAKITSEAQFDARTLVNVSETKSRRN